MNSKRNPLYFLYIIADFLITAVIVGMSFLSFAWTANLSSVQTTSASIFIFSVALVTVLVFWLAGIYKMLTRNFGLLEAIRISAIVFAIHIVALIPLMLIPEEFMHRMSLWAWILNILCLMFILPSLRLAARLFRLLSIFNEKKNAVRTIIIGAGASAKIVIDETRNNKSSANKIVLIIDDDAHKIGGTFSNIPIRGPISEVSHYIEEYKIEEVIIAISNLSPKRLREILAYLEHCPTRIKRMPLLSEMEGPNDTKVISVDLDELLCRTPVALDNEMIFKLLDNSTVLVTGAGGSIGSELVRQICTFKVKTIILFDIHENSTYEIQQELLHRICVCDMKIEVISLVGSTYDEKRVEQVFCKYRPDYVYHAAAYKHVPLMEDSPAEAIRTNVVGTYNVAKMADKYHVKKMVLISTDKAVRPTNVMGATKRFAEMIIQHFVAVSHNTIYSAVRFGNVLGSNGSVVPLFRKQIEAGGPVTITHKDIIRYFMTIPEAVSLIMQCSIFAKGGEIFVLDMGKPVRILSLAEKLIRNAGFIPNKDIMIVETGLRPGEKLFEELLIDTEHQKRTPNEKIFIESDDSDYPVEEGISKICQAFDMDDNDDIKDLLAEIIKTYKRTK